MATMTMSASPDIRVERWPSEIPLLVLTLIVSAGLWLFAIISIIGIFYGVFLGMFFFIMHLGFIAHVRGSGVRLGPAQFPEVHAAVERLAGRIGMKKVPEAYLIQGGGLLNALATRFAGSDILVLYTDLIEACGDDEAARDMIIAHELGHVHCGHLRWHFVMAPAMFVPFLFASLSRAREYTCDRFGRAGAGSTEGAVLGLTILAAGGRFGRRIDRSAFAAQASALNTGWMTLGEWFATHPPLVKRIAQLDPSLRDRSVNSARGAIRALAILGGVTAPVFIAGVVAALLFPAWIARYAPPRARAAQTGPPFRRPPAAVGTAQVKKDFDVLATFIQGELQAGHGMPWDTSELYDRWAGAHPGGSEPRDPFDGTRYAYQSRGNDFKLWSVGADGEWETNDDLTYDSRATRSGAAR
jgi:Zn-dependent protease with chaperone function